MINPKDPKVLKIVDKRSFIDRASVIEFIRELHDAEMMFHFDDLVSDISNFTEALSAHQINRFQANVNKMWEVCERLHLCPFDISLRIMNSDDPDSDWYNKKPIDFTIDTARMSEFYLAIFKMECPGGIENRDEALATAKVAGVYPQSAEETLAFEEATKAFLSGEH